MNESQEFKAFAERDLWAEARGYTAQQKPGLLMTILIWLISLIRPPTPITRMRFGTGESLLMVDLNKYRPGANVELLIDQGVRLFGLRVVGPRRWVFGDWQDEVDATFVPYYERIRAYAKQKGVVVWILGYGVHNAWSNEDNDYNGIDPQLKLLKEATRNHLCDLYAWDDEVGTCWKNGAETPITANNLVRSISLLMEQTLVEMERHPGGAFKIPVHYSANWFMKRYAPLQYQTWLDNAARDPAQRRFLTWRAWLPQVFSEAFATIRELFNKLVTPTGVQENAYLRMGSEPAADLWQCTFTAKGPWEAQLGIDASISYGQSAGWLDFARNANLPITIPQPPPDVPPPSGTLQEQIDELQVHAAQADLRIDYLEHFRDGVKAA